MFGAGLSSAGKILLEQNQQRATKMIKGLGHLSFNDSERADIAQPGEKKTQRDLNSVCEYLMGGEEKTVTVSS